MQLETFSYICGEIIGWGALTKRAEIIPFEPEQVMLVRDYKKIRMFKASHSFISFLGVLLLNET